MARKIRPRDMRKVIYVFWEGQSEKAYIKFLGDTFRKAANILPHHEKGLFFTAKASFRANQRLINDREELDEIWFFFDTEQCIREKWNEYQAIIRDLRNRGRNREPIRIRLLMTTSCVEYWFLLHYERTRPGIGTVAAKEAIEARVRTYVPTYQKGDENATAEIGRQYDAAIQNGYWVIEQMIADGYPAAVGEDERNRWLFVHDRTFTTVHEAVDFLRGLTA